ncbi:MAG: family 43 glycosylhydrolase [Planctomycetaceae bacterium]|jgi:hypothetical protein|nr:family 43 glycosylhydrolase [Planctomycetaceae bacterium]
MCFCASAQEFQWKNPLDIAYTEGQTAPRTEVRDPCIIKEGNRYYLTFTMYPFRNREEQHFNEPDQGGSPGIALYGSDDLKSWKFENWLVKSDELPEDCPYKNRFWAPEIHKINGKFYLVFTSDNWIKGEYNKPGKWGTAGYAFIGVADKITGPYEHITWIDGGPCDMSLFGDDDGKIYAVSPKYNVYVRQIDLSKLHEGKTSWIGEEILAVSCKNDDVALEDDPDYLEGPWMEKIGKRYYLFQAAIYKYPGQNKPHEYWTQVAYADNPMGPWKKDPDLRIFKGGHLVVFDGPDGKPWYCYRHENGVRDVHGRPCIDPIKINADGSIAVQETTVTPQTVSTSTRVTRRASGISVQQPLLELSTLIFDAIQRGEKKIDIPKGKYALELKEGRPMMFENLKDIEINGNGSEVICRIPSQVISVKNCENLKIKGFSFDSLILPYTQGTVVAVDPDKEIWIDIEIHGGYEKENVTSDRVQVFDPATQRLKKNLWTFDGDKLERLENGNWRMTFPHEDKNRKIEVGDLMVLGTKSTENLWTHTIVSDESTHCVFEDITLYFSNCFSFLEHGCHGNVYLRCRLIKKKNDPSKAFPRLRSGNADSFHSKFATQGPHIEECEFRNHGDDCIAINGNFYLVVSSEENKVLIFERHGHKLQMESGDPCRFTSFDGKILGDAKIVSVIRREDVPKEAVIEAVKDYDLAGGNKELPQSYRIYELTLDKPIDVKPGGNVYSLNRVGNGFVAKNNKIGFTRARGLLIKAANGDISGNTVAGCELGGIVVAPELYWLEAGYSANLTIENNTVKDCFFTSNTWGNSQPGAISVVAVDAKGEVMPAGAFRNITIWNNKISGCPYPAMVLTSIDGVVVSGNKITPPTESERREHGRRYAEKHDLDYESEIWQINNKELQQE